MREAIVWIKERMSLANKLKFASCCFDKHNLQKQPGEEWVYFNYRFQSITKRCQAETQGREKPKRQKPKQRLWRNCMDWLSQLLSLYRPGSSLQWWHCPHQFAIKEKNPTHVPMGQFDEDDSLSESLFPDVTSWQPRLYTSLYSFHFT